MANPSLQIGNSNWAIKEDNLLGYSTAGTRFVPQPITMTRASAGTRVNSSGLVETVELLGSDVVINGNFATDSDWTKGTGWSISGGSANCDGSQTGTTSLTPALNNVVNNVTYIVEYTISNYTSGSISIKLGNTGYGAVRTANGTYTEEITAQATTFPRSQINADVDFIGSIDNVSVKEVTKNNLARVDYDGTASSLLVEPQRTNLVAYSSDFTSWNQIANITLTQNSTTSPSGESDGTKFLSTSTGAKVRANFSAVSGTTYTFSVYCKNIDATLIKLLGYDGANEFNANLTSEVNTSTWTRISLTFTAANTATGQIQIARDLPDTESAYFWGAQLEAGSYPTSYIPTDGGTVTRVQDQYSKTGISNLINSEEGVLFVEMALLNNTGNYKSLSISDGTTDNRVTFENRPVLNQIKAFVNVSGTNVMSSTQTLTDVKEFNKMALKWKQNDFAWWVNGVEIYTDTSGNTFSADTLNRLAFDRGDGFIQLEGKVKQLQVFKTALTDSELIALTTL